MSERLSNYLDGRLARSSSNAFEKMGVKPGDHVYVITDKKGCLMLGGKIIVDKVLNQDEAQKYEDWGYCLPEWGKHIVMPLKEAGLFTPENWVPIEVVKKLWFISRTKPKSPKIDNEDKLVNQTLRGVRELDKDSALLLEEYLVNEEPLTSRGLLEIQSSFFEGKRTMVTHLIRERNPSAIYLTKRRRLKEVGELRCDVGGFSFLDNYGEAGRNFIEAHHTVPVSEMKEEGGKTEIEDIALVCSNCHRIIHQRNPCYSIEEMKKIVSN